MSHPAHLETLADLRVEIDCIDSELHQLLIKRGEIIHRLIEAKARQGGGSAFRPGREADMMRKLAIRHDGLLPLDTVESIWRIIISTFTYVQANYSVHADVSGGDGKMRDCCRFHFGFTVPYVAHQGASAVILSVAKSNGDLGLVRVPDAASAAPWWRDLADPQAPKIIARLPFVERPDHPAGTPLFVVSQPLAEAAARDIVLYAATIERRCDPALKQSLAALAEEGVGEAEILCDGVDDKGFCILLSASGDPGPELLRRAFLKAGTGEPLIAEIGGHAARFDVAEPRRAPAGAAVGAAKVQASP